MAHRSRQVDTESKSSGEHEELGTKEQQSEVRGEMIIERTVDLCNRKS